MLKKMMMIAGAMLAMTVPSLAAEWVVLKGSDACFVSDHKAAAGETQLGGTHASEAEATAAMKAVAECETVNTDPDPDDEGGPAPDK